MPLISEVFRAVQEFERASFQADEFDELTGPRVTAFFNNSNTARMVFAFLSDAQRQLPLNLHYPIYQSGLQVALLRNEGDSEKINPLFAQEIRKAISVFRDFLLSPWKKSPTSDPNKVCYSKEDGVCTGSLYRNLKSNIKLTSVITRADSLVGKEEDIIAFLQKLREEMEISSPEEEKKEDSPVEEGFIALRCAADVALFRGKVVAYKTMSSNQLLFGQISRDPIKWAGYKIGFQLRKARNEPEEEARTSPVLSNSYFNEPIFMREATEQETAEHSLKEA